MPSEVVVLLSGIVLVEGAVSGALLFEGCVFGSLLFEGCMLGSLLVEGVVPGLLSTGVTAMSPSVFTKVKNFLLI